MNAIIRQVLACAATVVALGLHPAAASGWKLAFEDNFNGNALNRDKWSTRFIYSNETTDHLNDEVQRYRDNGNHLQQNGELQLIAKPVGAGKYESGMIRSNQTFYYGYFETRVFFPKGRGVWPAFWLNPDYDRDGKLGWPPEIDIFEYVVNGKEDLETMVHSDASKQPGNAPTTFDFRDPKFNPRWKSYVHDGPLNEDWHVFGLLWTPDKISVFLDGKPLYTRPYQWLKKDGTLGAPAHVILNFAVGGQWAGRHGIDEANFPQPFRIDYVRVCQFSNGAGERECGGSKFTPNPAEFAYKAEFDDMPKPVLSDKALRLTTPNAPIKRSLAGDTTLAIANFIDQPTANRRLALSLKNVQTGIEMVRSNYPLTPGVDHQPSSFDYKIPPSIPAGDYYLTAALLAPNDANTAMPPVPVRCEGAAGLKPKALSCAIRKITLGAPQ